MFEIIGFLCLLAMLLVLLAKIYNISNKNEFYDKSLIMVGLVLSLFLWGFYFVILSGAIMQVETITGGGDTFTVVGTSYYYLVMFQPVVNFLLILNTFMTVIEIIYLFTKVSARPKGLRGFK